ncbi:MAG: acetylglutamate kinase [Bacilli bacterium]|nr:acetylglutamate kinase [Bacilli bacterium]
MNINDYCCAHYGIPCCFEQLYDDQFIEDNNFYYPNYINSSYQYQNDSYLRHEGLIKNITFLNLSNELRRLWEEHIIWTKLTIMALASDAPDTRLVTNRLLKNADDFGHLFAFFYDESIAEHFKSLIRDHLTIAADLVVAAKKGDNNSVKIIDDKWHKNADEIARFMNSINPYFNETDIKNMFYNHLELTKNEAVAILTNKYEEAIKIFDEIEIQALMMSDMFLEGFARQFSNQIIR